jgi:DNA-binding GntR family transcriptional regulator
MAARFQPLAKVPTLADEVADQLRSRILAGDFKLGERLVEAQIARELQISRAPVREALAKLNAEGLVQEFPRRGTFVTDLSEDEVREIYDLRAAIELRAVRLLFAADRAAVESGLDECIDAMDRAARFNKSQQLVELDLRFHETICRLTGNRRLHAVFTTYAGLVRILLALDSHEYYPDARQVVDEHRDLADLLTGGNLIAAERAFDVHLEDAKSRMVAFVHERRQADAARA